MELVRIIDPGKTYSSIGNNEGNWSIFGLNNYKEGVIPHKGAICSVSKRNDAGLSGIRDNTLTVNYGGYDVVIGTPGIEYINDEGPYVSVMDPARIKPDYFDLSLDRIDMAKPTSAKKIKSPPPIMPKIKKSTEGLELFELGDTIEVVNPKLYGYKSQYTVTDLNYPGYEVVVGTLGTNGKDKGFRFSDIKKVVILTDDEKPKFSKNEILEILNQKKLTEEILLDLMDHITN